MSGRAIVIGAALALGLSLAVFWYLQGRQGQPEFSSPLAAPSGSLAPGRPDSVNTSASPNPSPSPRPPSPGPGAAQPNIPSFADAQQNPISPQEAFSRLLAEAEGGSAPAMLNVAEFYGNGWGVRQNFSERFRWLQRASEAGDHRGTFRAALALETGLGVAADQGAARAALLKAAEGGLAEAHLKLGQELLSGPEGDVALAAGHLEAALAGGQPLAANILGLLYLEGAGNLAADGEKARQALQRGADLGDAEALKNLAVMHRQGWGGPQNSAEALKWYLAAREAGWQGGEEVLTTLKAEIGPQAAQKAEAEAKTWLESRKPAGPAG